MDADRDTAIAFELLVQGREAVSHVEDRTARSERVVFVQLRDPEHSHHCVADVLLHQPSVAFDRRAHRVEVPGLDVAQGFGIELLPELSGAGDVTEDDGDGLANLGRRRRRYERSRTGRAEREIIRALAPARLTCQHDLSVGRGEDGRHRLGEAGRIVEATTSRLGKDHAVTRFGLQLPSFTFPDVPNDRMFDRITEIAQAAEASGFDSFWVMDHYHQIRNIGPASDPMLEAYTLLGAVAARTSRVSLGAMVTGVTYRNPAFLAKVVTTLDIVSSGRAILGIGAAWNDEESLAYGYDWPSATERFERLEDALRICRAMFTQPQSSFEGTRHRVEGAYNNPQPIQAGGPEDLDRRRRGEEDAAVGRGVRRHVERVR